MKEPKEIGRAKEKSSLNPKKQSFIFSDISMLPKKQWANFIWRLCNVLEQNTHRRRHEPTHPQGGTYHLPTTMKRIKFLNRKHMAGNSSFFYTSVTCVEEEEREGGGGGVGEG